MNLSEYQQKAARTRMAAWSYRDNLLNAGLGAAGEAGEIANKVKKQIFHQHPNKAEIIEEIGDVLWYLAELCTTLGVGLDAVAQGNIEKLERRFPDGFSVERSINRDNGPASLNAVENEHNIEPETGDIVNWNWLNMEPIRYPQRQEGVTLADYTEGSGVE